MASDFLSELREKTRTPEEIEKERIEKKKQLEINNAIKSIKLQILNHAEKGDFKILENGRKQISFIEVLNGFPYVGGLINNIKDENDYWKIQVHQNRKGMGVFRGSFDVKCTVNIYLKDMAYDILNQIKKELIRENIHCEFDKQVILRSDIGRCNNSFYFTGNETIFKTDWEDKSFVVKIKAKISVTY